jgi:YegS/Rv2252/BmrU family lipid kinase
MFNKYYFIVNPAAGRGKKLSFLSEVELFCRRKGLQFEIAITKQPREAIELAKKVAEKFEVIVAVGGDGTVNEVANGLIGTSAVLGILPVGSGNDFAKQVGYVRNLKKDLNFLLAGRVKKIDVGLINNRCYFINAFSVGFDGEVAARVKKFIPYGTGFFAYLASALKTLVTYKFRRAKIVFDGNNVIDPKILLMAVCNGTTYGGGFRVAPSAKMDDGFFTICLAEKMGRFYALRNIPKMIKGTHINLPSVHMFTSKRVIIETENELTAQIDGEILPLNKRYEVQLLEKYLKVIVK